MGFYNPLKRELITSKVPMFSLDKFYEKIKSSDDEDIYKKEEQYAVVVRNPIIR